MNETRPEAAQPEANEGTELRKQGTENEEADGPDRRALAEATWAADLCVCDQEHEKARSVIRVIALEVTDRYRGTRNEIAETAPETTALIARFTEAARTAALRLEEGLAETWRVERELLAGICSPATLHPGGPEPASGI